MEHRVVLKQILASFSLSPNCHHIYVYGFEHGESSVGEIANGLHMDRSSAYLAIEELQRQGLVQVLDTQRPKIVQVVSPRTLLSRIERKIQQYEDVFEATHNAIDQLESAMQQQSHKPVLQTYSGKEGLQHITDDILDSEASELRLFTNPKAEQSVFSKQDHAFFIRKRKSLGITIKAIATSSEAAKILQRSDNRSLRTTKILTGPAPFTCETYIYGNKVAMLDYSQDIIGFIVDSTEYARQTTWTFDFIWEHL